MNRSQNSCANKTCSTPLEILEDRIKGALLYNREPQMFCIGGVTRQGVEGEQRKIGTWLIGLYGAQISDIHVRHKYTNLPIFHRQTTEFQLLSKNPSWKWASNNIEGLRSFTRLHPTFKTEHIASVMVFNFVHVRIGTSEHKIIRAAFKDPGLLQDDIDDVWFCIAKFMKVIQKLTIFRSRGGYYLLTSNIWTAC